VDYVARLLSGLDHDFKLHRNIVPPSGGQSLVHESAGNVLVISVWGEVAPINGVEPPKSGGTPHETFFELSFHCRKSQPFATSQTRVLARIARLDFPTAISGPGNFGDRSFATAAFGSMPQL